MTSGIHLYLEQCVPALLGYVGGNVNFLTVIPFMLVMFCPFHSGNLLSVYNDSSVSTRILVASFSVNKLIDD